jgi:hypothetical protein
MIESSSAENSVSADLFLNPPVDYRSAPFYSLNDKLDTTELARQIHGFKSGGFGGSFLHSRAGLLTEYMGSEWWEAMDVAVRTSKEIGITAWFYDEDKWPSGFAGGKIPLLSEDFHARCLSRVRKGEILEDIDSVLFEDDCFKYIIHKARMGEARFHGTCYADLLNPEMVKAFIDCAYAPYLDRYKDEIGKTVPGIFTDEPQIRPQVSGGRKGSVSFSPFVVDKFRAMHGYDLLPAIPSLFDAVGNFKKVRYQYYQTISRCFEKNYTEQIGDYCRARKTVFTGHLTGEESSHSVMLNSGNSMVNYRHMQMPGMDILGLNFSPLNTPKSVASVANQYGIRWRLSESYGICGQNMSFEDRKWLLDYLTINGINFIVPHLALYSMKGERKRDFPPTFSPAQPYWEYNKLFEDYSGRMCYVNTLGRYAADLLVLHPLESEYLGVENECYQKYDECLNLLQKQHRDYDLGDEQIISEIAKVEGQELVLGQMAYKSVVLPHMLVLRNSTLEILKQFSASGGQILVYGRFPEYVDGDPNPEALESLKRISRFVSEDDLPEVLNQVLPADYKLEGDENELIWTHLRKVTNGGILQLSNTSRLREVNGELLFSFSAINLALWNPENGRSMKLVPEKDGRIKLHFAAAQSWVVTFGSASKEADFEKVYQPPGASAELVKLQGPWQGKRLDPNALTLDFACYSTDNGQTFSLMEPVIGIHQRLTKDEYTGKLILKFEPQVAVVPDKCSLVAEQPHLYQFSVNGEEIRFEGAEYYCDHAFRVQDISGTLKEGRNEILLSVDYMSPQPASLNAIERYGTEIESIYLIGDFAVSAVVSDQPFPESQKYHDKTLVEKPVYLMTRFEITREATSFDDDLVLHGYPFYAGKFAFSKSFKIEQVLNTKRYVLSFPSFEAIALNVKVNGKELSPLIFSPWETEISEVIKEGENIVEVEMVNSLRNLLGPHHHSGGELKEVGPASFTGNPQWPNVGGDANWYDLRINGSATLWRDAYCIIPFGLLAAPLVSVSSFHAPQRNFLSNKKVFSYSSSQKSNVPAGVTNHKHPHLLHENTKH